MTETTSVIEGETSPRRARRIGFRVVVGLALLAVVGLFAAFWPPDLTHPVTGWLPDATLDRYMETFATEEDRATLGALSSHRHHFMAGSFFLWASLIGLMTQLRRPERNQAPLWVAASAWVLALVFGTALVGLEPFFLVFAVPILGALALHPRRLPGEGVSWVGPGRPAAAAVAVAGLIYAAGQVRLQVIGIEADPHVADGHYAYVAAAAVMVTFAGILGSSNLTGARITAWAAGLMVTLAGALWIRFPDHASSPGVAWGAITVALGLAYLGAVAWPRRVEAGA